MRQKTMASKMGHYFDGLLASSWYQSSWIHRQLSERTNGLYIKKY